MVPLCILQLFGTPTEVGGGHSELCAGLAHRPGGQSKAETVVVGTRPIQAALVHGDFMDGHEVIVLTRVVCAHALADLIKVHEKNFPFRKVDCEGTRGMGPLVFVGETLPHRAEGSVEQSAQGSHERCLEVKPQMAGGN